jgi:catechol 2,3-dioxygenase-like lactoylglutathione lyase family enzyme
MGIDMVYSRTPWAVYQARLGPGTARLKRWFENPGYDVDVAAVREQFPGMLSFEEYLVATGWQEKKPTPQSEEDGRLNAFSHVTVGVADLNVAFDLWVDAIGMEVVAQASGRDEGLASLWNIEPGSISRQALLYTPGKRKAGIHFVEFTNPGAPVREGANVFDLVPKNLDIFAQDLPAKYELLKAAGAKFRGEPSEVTAPNGVTFREVHLLAHDFVNVVLVEVVGDEHDYSPKGFLALGPVITIAPDANVEKQFWMDALGLQLLSDNLLSGPEVERMVGLPPGSGLDIKIVGDKSDHQGAIEIVEYQGVEGNNLYPLAHAPALGNLHVNYRVPDLGPLRVRLAAAGVDIVEYDAVNTIFGSGVAISFHTPAGLRVEVHERADDE